MRFATGLAAAIWVLSMAARPVRGQSADDVWRGARAGDLLRLTHLRTDAGEAIFEGRFVSADRAAARLRIADPDGRSWVRAEAHHVVVVSERSVNDSIDLALPWAELTLAEVGTMAELGAGARAARGALIGGVTGGLAGLLLGIQIGRNQPVYATPPVLSDVVGANSYGSNDVNPAYAGAGAIIGAAVGALVGIGLGDDIVWRPVHLPTVR